jgi:hypothetical protein
MGRGIATEIRHPVWGGARRGVLAAGLVITVVCAVLLSPRAVDAAGEPPADEWIIANDALQPPDLERAASGGPNSVAGNTLSGVPGYDQTSVYMIGDVAVGLILPESHGGRERQSEDWTDEEIARVQAEVQSALDWWAALEPAAHLTFSVEVQPRVPTGYEPITHGLAEEGLWIGETMAALGFEASSYFSAVRSYVNDLRTRTGADWAFAVFVVDSSADADGRFVDNYFAYAYVGGPFLVMTYDNSSYGISNMGAVAAHEIGHVFNALDQYAAAGVSCEYRAGYLEVKNGNSQAGGDCETNESSIMRGGIAPFRTRSIDQFARGQVGWWDSDQDGVLDPVDALPQLAVDQWGTPSEEDALFWLSGRAWQEPAPAPGPVPVTVSTVSTVEAWLDEETWVAAQPIDGGFDTLSETFRLEVGPLVPGLHTVELRSVNSEGLVSSSVLTTTFVPDPVDGALNSALKGDPVIDVRSGSAHLSGLATAAYGDNTADAPVVELVQFQMDGGEWYTATPTDGTFDGAIESFEIQLTDLTEGTHHVVVRAVDSLGHIESNPAQRPFEVRASYRIFIPALFH